MYCNELLVFLSQLGLNWKLSWEQCEGTNLREYVSVILDSRSVNIL